jgi:hypothetical protein
MQIVHLFSQLGREPSGTRLKNKGRFCLSVQRLRKGVFMFLQNSFFPGSLRRIMARSVFILILSVIFLMGCDTDPDDFVDDHKLNSKLIGTWTSNGMDKYVIDQGTLTYYGWMGSIDYSGTIEYVSNFTSKKNSGVIIIKYNADNKLVWYDYDPETWEETPKPEQPEGDYYGIYFSKLTANSVELSSTSDQKNNYGPSETVTLEQAKKRFTVHSMGDWINTGYITAYSKSTE